MSFSLTKLARNAAITFALVAGVAAVAPGDVRLVATAEAGNCTLLYEYVDENGQRWGVYQCARTQRRISCSTRCEAIVWDFRDEQ